jgi:hypothetical protein
MNESHHKLDEYLHVTCEIARAYVFCVAKAMAENFQSIYIQGMLLSGICPLKRLRHHHFSKFSKCFKKKKKFSSLENFSK